jgi:molecular chaperone DnaJ
LPRDHYIVLGVSRGADLNRIKKAYRTVVKKYHPDTSNSPESAERFREIREAYDTLSDQDKRREYDQELERQGSSLRISRMPEVIERRRSVFDELESVFTTSTDEFFEGFLSGFFDFGKGRIREKDLYYEAILTPEEAANGGLFPITFTVFEPCPRCKKGGFDDDFICRECMGYGRIKSERQFSLNVPPRVSHGTRVKVSMDDIGIKGVYLNIIILVDHFLEEDMY